VSLPDVKPRKRAGLPALLALAAIAALAVVLLADPFSGGTAKPPAAAVSSPEPPPLPYKVPETPADSKLPEAFAFVAPGGNDAGTCTSKDPCATFARAYRAAQPGDVVEVAAGTYPEQIMPRDDTRLSDRDVTFRPAPGASVKLAGLTFGQWTDDRGASHVQVRDMDVGEIMARRTDDLTFRNLTMRSFWVEGGRDIRFVGGSIGGIKGANPWLGTWRGADGSTDTPKDVVIEDVDFHDVRMQKAADHIECLHVNDVDGLVVRNSSFRDCDTFDMLVMYGYNEVLRDILIEHNEFASTGNSFGGPSYFGLSLRFGHNVTVRNNTSSAPWAGPDAGGGPVTGAWLVEGNTFPGLQSCPGGVTFRDNTWTGKHAEACGPTDQVAGGAA
jgi:hypothetical protein